MTQHLGRVLGIRKSIGWLREAHPPSDTATSELDKFCALEVLSFQRLLRLCQARLLQPAIPAWTKASKLSSAAELLGSGAHASPAMAEGISFTQNTRALRGVLLHDVWSKRQQHRCRHHYG